ncbi:MAG: TrmH family RNA methyltransferase [Deltaproteobacteria bacterium]|nr:TrmH family RNA methyltransferase [Deltaproteobacteria bacterium]
MDDPERPAVGVGPHPRPWPEDPRLDPELLAGGDRRNVLDRYRYWRVEAIVEDLDARRHPLEVAIENWRSDPNIGAVVRNANAFGVGRVHIVGRHRWNRRGAMMTERYLHLFEHPTLEGLLAHARQQALPLIGIDNLPGSSSLHESELPRRCLLLFGQEGEGLSPEAREVVERILHVPQYGSTRSINAGAASAVAMAEWCRRHAGRGQSSPGSSE